MVFAEICYEEADESQKRYHYNLLCLLQKGGLVQQKEGATFKDSLKKIIKIIYSFLILQFYLYFYPSDSLTQKIV